jgi:MtN3 and saliva related transmembrane protein
LERRSGGEVIQQVPYGTGETPGCATIQVSLSFSGGPALSLTEYLGLLAGLFSTIALVPQIMRVYKLKSAREISVLYNLALMLGLVLWLVYGILLALVPIIIWNIIGLLLTGLLLLAKFRYGR